MLGLGKKGEVHDCDCDVDDGDATYGIDGNDGVSQHIALCIDLASSLRMSGQLHIDGVAYTITACVMCMILAAGLCTQVNHDGAP